MFQMQRAETTSLIAVEVWLLRCGCGMLLWAAMQGIKQGIKHDALIANITQLVLPLVKLTLPSSSLGFLLGKWFFVHASSFCMSIWHFLNFGFLFLFLQSFKRILFTNIGTTHVRIGGKCILR